MGVKDSDPTTRKLTIYHFGHIQQSATDTRQWTGIWTLFSQHVVTASKPKSSFIHSKSEVHYRPREVHLASRLSSAIVDTFARAWVPRIF